MRNRRRAAGVPPQDSPPHDRPAPGSRSPDSRLPAGPVPDGPVPDGEVDLWPALLEHSDEAVVVYRAGSDRIPALAWANAAFCRLAGRALADLVGSVPGHLLAPDTDPEAVSRVFSALAHGEEVHEELTLRRHDGTHLWTEVAAFVVRGTHGERWHCATYRDVSERRREQSRFQALVENVHDVVVVVDAEFRITYVSLAIRALLGYDPDELVGLPAFELIPVEGADHYRDLFTSGEIMGSAGEAFEVRARRRDGTSVVLEVTLNDRMADPAIEGLVVTARDITDRAEAVEQLRRSEEWAHALLEGGADAVLVTDAEGIIYYTSPAIEALVGFRPDELSGTNCLDLVEPAEWDRLIAEWGDLLDETEDYLPAQFPLLHRDGTLRRAEISARNLLHHPAVRGMVIHVRDITERWRSEAALRQSEQWAQALVQRGSDLVVVTDAEGRVLYASPAAEPVLGCPPEDLVGTDLFELFHPDTCGAAREVFEAEMAGEESPIPTRVRARRADGRWVHLSMTFTDMLGLEAVGGVVINIRDITARWEAEQLLGQQAQALEAVARGAPLDTTLYRVAQMLEDRLAGAHVALGVVDDDGTILMRAAPTLDRQSVVALDEVRPDSPLGVAVRGAGRRLTTFTGLARDPRWAPLMERVPKLARFSCWSMLITRPGNRETLGCVLVFHPDQRPPSAEEHELLERLMSLAAIAIERRNFEAALEHQALHDDLTALPNRTLLLDRISQALARSLRHHTQVAVLFIDLDRFKVINDSLGHSMGDELLRQAASRLRQPLRLGDTLGRLGGDEFLVVCERIEGEAGAMEVADRLLASMAAPFLLGDTEVFVSASVGVAVSGEQPVSAEALVRNADMAMYRAKEQGRSRAAMFEEDLAKRALERHELEQALRSALEAAQFELHYQPLVRLADGAVTGVEALVRWKRPGLGLVEPSEFVPVAEEAGLILPLGAWVIEQACAQAARWPSLPDGSSVRVTVNLSARQLADPGLIDFIAGHVEGAGLAPERLCFEITESVLVDDVDTAVATVEKLKALGVLIAIDDFGTGYATLEYLRRFSMADYLKIDRSFVEGVDTGGSKETAIVAGAIALAKSLDFTVVAEGVQTEAQVSTLRGLDCDLAQGFFFSRPLPAAAAVALLESSPTMAMPGSGPELSG